jgi:signal transduction histidine kinase
MGDGACSDSALDPLRDRVEALAGRLTIQSEPGARTLLVGSLPLSG